MNIKINFCTNYPTNHKGKLSTAKYIYICQKFNKKICINLYKWTTLSILKFYVKFFVN